MIAIRACLLVAALVCMSGLLPARSASAHAELVRASPPPDGLLAAPPQEIELWTTERVAVGSGSPLIDVLDESGVKQSVSNIRVDPNDPRHILADVSGVGAGTYTVTWTVRSDDDGHTLSGSFAFRVGTGRAPGAATVDGESPRVWAVATRWLTFLGAAIAAAGFLFGFFIQSGVVAGSVLTRRRALAIVVGSAIALIATIAEPFLQTKFPPEGALKPSLGDAISGLPTAWWLRPSALAIALVLGVIFLFRGTRGRAPGLVDVVSGAVPLIALIGLALTSHASARESWRFVAVPSIILHQLSVGLWVGGLVHLALSWRHRSAEVAEVDPPDPVRQFSKYALGLALAGIGTGVVNAGFVLPTVRSLWNSDYGTFLIVKVAILVPVLVLASFHRLTLRRVAERVGAALQMTVRLETALILLVVLGGSILALLAPPTGAHGDVALVDLAAPTSIDNSPDALLVRLQVSPARPGKDQITVIVAKTDKTPVPVDQIALVRLGFTSLDHDAEQLDVATSPNSTGGFSTNGAQLSLDGWWRVNVLVRRLGLEDVTVPFYLRLPDPNVNGFEASEPAGPDDARAVFERGLAGMTTMHTVRWTQRLAGGTGTVVVSQHMVSDGSDGQPPSSSLVSAEFEQIVIGDRRWQRQPGTGWIESEGAPVYAPSEWGSSYEGATGAHLGRVEEVDGEQAQIVTFYVPGTPQLAPAYYSWWVGVESGRVLRETMVSRFHYMVYDYGDFDQPLPIAAPTDA